MLLGSGPMFLASVTGRRTCVTTLLTSALLLSCGETALTQVVVGIDTELCEPGDSGTTPEFDRVDVTVDGADPLCAVFDRDEEGCIRVSSGDMPLRLPVLSESGTGRLAVTVELRNGADIVGCGSGAVDFAADETQRFYGVVPRPCADADCGAVIFDALEGDPTEPFPTAIACEPPPPAPATPVRRIAAGDAHACLVDGDGTLFCWGANDRGQLGLGDLRTRARPTPLDLGAGRSVQQIDGGRAHTCAVISNGPNSTVSCWGNNSNGQVGNGEASESPVVSPTTVPGTAGAVEVAAGPNHTCARFEDGGVRCWGSNAAGESSGTPGAGDVLAPTSVSQVEGAIALDVGGNNPEASLRHSCAIGSSEGNPQTWCWGANDQGQLGSDGGLPLAFPGDAEPVQVALGARESCASAAPGELMCWGFNLPPGTLGIGVDSVENVTAPVLVEATVLPPVTSLAGPRLPTLAAGDSYRCFLDPSTRPFCVGNNAEGRLGSASSNTETPVSVNVPDGIRFAQIAVGGSFGCALPEDGSLPFCWGSNSRGQIGNGSAAGAAEPQRLLSCE